MGSYNGSQTRLSPEPRPKHAHARRQSLPTWPQHPAGSDVRGGRAVSAATEPAPEKEVREAARLGIGTPTPDLGWADPGFAYSINGCDPANGYIIQHDGANAGLVSDGAGGFTKPSGAPVFINGNNNGELYSFHTGGINVCMADGSVRFISQTISAATFAALVTAQGGDIVGSDF